MCVRGKRVSWVQTAGAWPLEGQGTRYTRAEQRCTGALPCILRIHATHTHTHTHRHTHTQNIHTFRKVQHPGPHLPGGGTPSPPPHQLRGHVAGSLPPLPRALLRLHHGRAHVVRVRVLERLGLLAGVGCRSPLLLVLRLILQRQRDWGKNEAWLRALLLTHEERNCCFSFSCTHSDKMVLQTLGLLLPLRQIAAKTQHNLCPQHNTTYNPHIHISSSYPDTHAHAHTHTHVPHHQPARTHTHLPDLAPRHPFPPKRRKARGQGWAGRWA